MDTEMGAWAITKGESWLNWICPWEERPKDKKLAQCRKNILILEIEEEILEDPAAELIKFKEDFDTEEMRLARVQSYLLMITWIATFIGFAFLSYISSWGGY
jgi:hypothetical protein